MDFNQMKRLFSLVKLYVAKGANENVNETNFNLHENHAKRQQGNDHRV